MENHRPQLEIEKQLLKEGFVSSEEMASVRQAREMQLRRSHKPLGLILLDQGQILQKQLEQLMMLPEIQARMGALAVERQLITQDHLMACSGRVRKNGPSLTRMLVDEGFLSDTDRKKLMVAQLDSLTLAKQAIKHHMILENDLEAALKLKRYQQSTCEILFERNLITLSELNHAFRKFSQDLKLGQILINQDLISETDLQRALTVQASENRSLGKILLEIRSIAIEQLYFALSIQYNTPFQKLGGYVYYEKQKVALRDIVGQRYAYDHMILPLFQSGNNLTLGVSNPANIRAMHELKSMYPALQMTCVLIFEEKFEQLYALLYGEIMKMNSGRAEVPHQSYPDGLVVIRNPGEEQSLIESLYQTYQANRPRGEDEPAGQDDAAWFFEFIDESYQIICEKYGCRRVQFRCVVKDRRAEILALPVNQA